MSIIGVVSIPFRADTGFEPVMCPGVSSMIRKYKYSNTKFWLLIAACLGIFITSVGFHAVSIRAYERREWQDFAHAVDMLLTDTARSLLERTIRSTN